nr:hypothetical protein [Tanacetum cinerariifolium]
MQDGKDVMVNELAVNLGFTESSGTESRNQDESNRKGNDPGTYYVDIKPTYDEEPMAAVQLTDE